MIPTLPPLSSQDVAELSDGLRDPVTYRKSGLSLNHVIGCPLDCAYCIRHRDNNYEMKQPHAIMSDEDAVALLLRHKYFQPDITPIQVFNKATDGFLPIVQPHLFRTLELLDQQGLHNHTLLITRYRVSEAACARLNEFRNLTITLLITYSGIDDRRIEPIANEIPIKSLKPSHSLAERYRVVLYWRPIVPGLNDSDEHLATALSLSAFAHATVFTGLFYNSAIKDYFESCGLPHLYEESARRKILPETLEQRILSAARGSAAERKLFRKTSCGIAFAHGVHDYNGHYGIAEICDICPGEQIERCAAAFKKPTAEAVSEAAARIGCSDLRFEITDRAVETVGLDEEPRYFLQHSLGFQTHDVRYPHFYRRHGRADTGWSSSV